LRRGLVKSTRKRSQKSSEFRQAHGRHAGWVALACALVSRQRPSLIIEHTSAVAPTLSACATNPPLGAFILNADATTAVTRPSISPARHRRHASSHCEGIHLHSSRAAASWGCGNHASLAKHANIHYNRDSFSPRNRMSDRLESTITITYATNWPRRS
jgi:hypothetical protein